MKLCATDGSAPRLSPVAGSVLSELWAALLRWQARVGSSNDCAVKNVDRLGVSSGSRKSEWPIQFSAFPARALRWLLLLGRDLLGFVAASLDADDPADLNDTRNTQPALFVVESLIVDELRRQGRAPVLVAGHSLGELVALYAAEVFDAATGLELMQRRSELMAAAGGGAMAAVIGFERSQLDDLVNATEGVVIANDNSAAQVVLSGTADAVKAVGEALTCKRVIPLAVSGAFHSPFMHDAADAFSQHLNDLTFEDARFPVLSNTDPTPAGMRLNSSDACIAR